MTLRTTTLDNGLRIVTDSMPYLETATIGMWVGVGARAESPEVNGISHMLEHMAFKGTDRRSALRIAEEIESAGGHLNAYTSREQTAYYARVLKADVPLALDILADILQHSTFEDVELQREREVVIQEIGETLDTPDDVVFDFLQAAAFPDQPLGRTILGTADHVRGFQADTLQAYMSTHYRAPGMVLAGAGAVDHEAVVALAAELFGALATDNGHKPQEAEYRGGEGRDRRQLEQVHLTMGFRGLAFDDPDFYALQVFSTVLGGGMSSRLFQQVREIRGLAYSIYSFASSYVDGGLFGVYAGTGPGQVAELVPVIADELGRICDDAGEEEVARARAQLKAGLMMALESSSSRCEQIARQTLIFGRVLPVDEVTGAVDSIDATAVRRIGRRLLGGGAKPSIAAVGPLDNLDSYERISQRFA